MPVKPQIPRVAFYLVATVAVALTWLLRQSLNPLLGPDTPFVVLFFLPVIVSAWIGGLGPGCFATIIALLVGDKLSVNPPPFAIPMAARLIRASTFIGEGILISYLLAERKNVANRLRIYGTRLKNLTAKIQTIGESERLRIAREIHDQLGQSLTGLKFQLSLLGKISEKGKIDLEISQMMGVIDENIHLVRRIATELRPGILDELGLIAAIEWHVNEFQTRMRIKCHVSTPTRKVDISQDIAIAVFRILQEILTNVTRHSNATEITVMVECNGILVLEVTDNGRGIKEEEIDNPVSLGILGMRERAELFHGNIQFSSLPDIRTTVRVEIPLHIK
ncbi:MAG: sensor histidine kinase [Verrucomicrobiota bacterium]|nr:sensor histidine kinase [Verrucomicrobiota bacterium]